MSKALLVPIICLPLAMMLGVMLSDPMSGTNQLFVGIIMMAMLLPLIIHSHHAFLIISWNSFINAFFLPGQPFVWVVMSFISLGFSILSGGMSKDMRFLNVRSITLPLIIFAVLIVVTAEMRGGFGARAFNSSVYGAKRYFYLLGGIVGYFALSIRAIPPERRRFMASIFFIMGMTAMLSNIVYAAGPSFMFLFYLFPPEFAMSQAAADYSVGAGVYNRLAGLAPASLSLLSYLLIRNGLKGLFDLSRPWRIFLLFISGLMAIGGGFRSTIILMMLLFGIQFYLEGLHRTRWLPILLTLILFGFLILIPLVPSLPLAAQRSLSFLPLDIDPIAKTDAKNSLDWRFDMWRDVLQDVPNYLWVGKGYAINPTDTFMLNEGWLRGFNKSYESFIAAGDYHSGPLSVLMPFGVFGSLVFIWFLLAGLKALIRNYRHGDPSCKTVNTFLLAYYIARIIYFVVCFGALNTDFYIFAGIVAFSISFNGGVGSPKPVTVFEQPRLQPNFGRPSLVPV